MEKSKRIKLWLRIMLPVFFIASIFSLILEFQIYRNADLVSIRARETFKRAHLPLDKDQDYLILGDSSALFSIAPKMISLNSSSRTMLGSSIYLSEKLLYELDLSRIKKGIILSQSFISDHYNRDLWRILVPNGLISLKQVYELHEINNLYEYVSYGGRFWLSRLHLDAFAMEALMSRLKPQDFSHEDFRTAFILKLDRDAGHFETVSKKLLPYDKFVFPYYEIFNRSAQIPPRELRALLNIVTLAASKNIPVIFVKIPNASRSLNLNTERFDNSVSEILRQINSPYFRIIDGTLLANLERNDFLDFNHLNSQGAKKFSASLARELNKISLPHR